MRTVGTCLIKNCSLITHAVILLLSNRHRAYSDFKMRRYPGSVETQLGVKL